MKLIQGILGCALAAGLMTFAPSQSKAGVVGADGVLYSPISLKLTISKLNNNEKISKQTVTSKEVLKELGYNSDVVLALSIDTGDVVIINKKGGSIIRNLSNEGIMFVDVNEYLSDYKSNEKGASTYNSTGLVDITYNNQPEVSASIAIPTSEDYFEVTGAYTGTIKNGNINKNGEQNVSTKAEAKGLSGSGYFSELYPDSTVVTGSASVKGDGKVSVGG